MLPKLLLELELELELAKNYCNKVFLNWNWNLELELGLELKTLSPDHEVTPKYRATN